jgi:ABC-type Zn uptake system ZnuABC Zn-binding protein ZnuA
MRIRFLQSLHLLPAVFAAACAGPGVRPSPPEKRLVLTSFQPLYSLASAVAEGSPALEVVNLAPRALGPHDFDPADPAHAARCRDLVRRADAVATLRGLPLAPAFDRLYPWCRAENIRIVEIDPSVAWDPATPKLPLIENPRDTAHALRNPSSPVPRPPSLPTNAAVPNPHIWLSLTHAARLVEGIARDFAALDPDRAPLYRANAERRRASLRGLKAEFEGKFAAVDRPAVAALTEGFPYLTAEFGIEVADYILEPADAAEVGARVRAAGVKAVIAEEPPTPEVARAVEAAGAKVVVLSTIETGWGTGDALERDGYFRAMRENLERLLGAMQAG